MQEALSVATTAAIGKKQRAALLLPVTVYSVLCYCVCLHLRQQFTIKVELIKNWRWFLNRVVSKLNNWKFSRLSRFAYLWTEGRVWLQQRTSTWMIPAWSTMMQKLKTKPSNIENQNEYFGLLKFHIKSTEMYTCGLKYIYIMCQYVLIFIW